MEDFDDKHNDNAEEDEGHRSLPKWDSILMWAAAAAAAAAAG
eukprot:CAMPEP_0194754526 /NCGR_PEP_ID=MMETSP0323_2-20130528/8484_1 /TAXON_ID=2866 ORGANISM="Crypthecodinium cohnii, Strain Seligo" /NCGR_SAMPLE_ID=MMETSP0323_2 /ASSEMBLY_ACC=CAM_ASM_000346 /LENGTH=41 /DNA_ID= /DNA_START= /DNA_END= /DNA_ORIENTATION=